MELHIHMRFPKRTVDRELFEMIDVAFTDEGFYMVDWTSGPGNSVGIWIDEPIVDWVKYPAHRRFDIPSNASNLTVRFECETPTLRDLWVNIPLAESRSGRGYESDYLRLSSKQTTMGQENIEKRDFALRRYRIARFFHKSLGAYETKACTSNDGEQ